MDERVSSNKIIALSIESNYDHHVMGTSEDALKAKYAAVQAGYYNDPYIAAFRNESLKTSTYKGSTRPPVQVIIKRGTYARVVCIYKVISTFIEECRSLLPETTNVQVVVLGSGKDTTFFRIRDEQQRQDRESSDTSIHQQHLQWFEVDHDVIVRQKTNVIQKYPIFASQCNRSTINENVYEVTQQPSTSSTSSSTKESRINYHLVAHNLNDDPIKLVDALLQHGLDPTAPTLVVLECVLMYVTKDSATILLQALINKCTDCTLISYEPILGHVSSFGRVMEENLTKAGVAQPASCLVEIRTISQWIQLYCAIGCQFITGCDMYTAYETILSPSQRSHAQKCEFLDELEEFILIMQHYCFVASCNNIDSLVGKKICAVDSIIGFDSERCEQLSSTNS
jgi:[phosphatase 2A protein]-leucine-carboxy methyltransferase